MAKHTMVSYYGMNYVEHAEKDFLEMLEQCGADCDTRERKALFAFVYYSVVCLKKA